MRLIKFLAVMAPLTLVACAGDRPADHAARYLELYDLKAPQPHHFQICYNNGCASHAELTLDSSEWGYVRNFFTPKPANAYEEKQRIAMAISGFEKMIGEKVGTKSDKGGNLAGMFEANQQDCVDESINTTTYLLMMENAGLLQFHKVGGPVTRGHFISGYPHRTATIEDKETGRIWAVDSWFLDNGALPQIVNLETWRSGWDPDDLEDEHIALADDGSWRPLPPHEKNVETRQVVNDVIDSAGRPLPPPPAPPEKKVGGASSEDLLNHPSML